jgi:hypothetical protein
VLAAALTPPVSAASALRRQKVATGPGYDRSLPKTRSAGKQVKCKDDNVDGVIGRDRRERQPRKRADQRESVR